MNDKIKVNKVLSQITTWMETKNIFVPILLILAGVLLLYQFLIVIIGPLCLFLGIWFLVQANNRNEVNEEDRSDHQ